MKKRSIALTIAGSDSGGGAGIQADLNTFQALGVHGTSVIACLTAQNPRRVRGALAVDAGFVREQLEAVFEELPPGAMKTGMLFNAEIIETVREFIEGLPVKKQPPLVIDPVMVSTSGAQLLRADAVSALKRLFPLAALLTPNLDEAAALLGRELGDVEDLRSAARELFETYGCAALVKGGHLLGMKEAVDIFYDGREELLLSAAFVKGAQTHGTGCTYSAAIAAWLARGLGLAEAVGRAKEFITGAIAGSRRVGRWWALGWEANDK